MADERFAKVKALFMDLLDLDHDKVAVRLAEVRAQDQGLADEVGSLLREGRSGPNYLDHPPVPQPSNELRPGVSVGRYRIVRFIDAGSTGTVYEAEQDKPRRRVALKVLQPGSMGPQSMRRFEREAELLAQLSHPNIGAVFDAGSADAAGMNRPYFAMELVTRGRITTYCDTHHLDLRDRVSLVVKMCDAVQYAHSQGVIHRDIKPGNVLVSESGEPKLVDFGIARLIEGDRTLTAEHLRADTIFGSFAYMAPEQASGDATRVDTRADVYAIGGLLYCLLAGRPIREVGHLSVVEALAEVREGAVRPLTTVLPSIPRDLAAIVNAALAKEPADRYQSAAEFKADLVRFLTGEPVSRDSRGGWRQLRIFVRRNKSLVSATMLGLVVAGAGLGVGAMAVLNNARDEARRAAEADRLMRQRMALVSTIDFVLRDLGMFKDSPERDPTMQLESMSKGIGKALTEFPDLEAAVRTAMALTYWGRGLQSRALQEQTAALELTRRVYGEFSPRFVSQTLTCIGWSCHLGRFQEVCTRGQSIKELTANVATKKSASWRNLIRDVAWAQSMMGRHEEAIQALRDLLSVEESTGVKDEYSYRTLEYLGEALLEARRPAEAEPFLRRAFEEGSAAMGCPDPALWCAEWIDAWGRAALDLGLTAEADERFSRAFEMRMKGMGTFSVETLRSRAGLAKTWFAEGRSDQALREMSMVVEIADSLGERGNPFYLACHQLDLARMLEQVQRRDEASEHLARAQPVLMDCCGPEGRLSKDAGELQSLLKSESK